MNNSDGRAALSSRKADLFYFGLLGAATFALSFWVQTRWLNIAAGLICAALLVFGARRRRWIPLLAFAGAHLLCLGAFFAILFGTPAVEDYASRTAFDSAGWKAENRDGAQGFRVRMVDDLLRRHKLVGMSRDELENLLGVPPATNYFRQYDYVYWLGQERGFLNIDSEWLALKFNGDVVSEADVVRD